MPRRLSRRDRDREYDDRERSPSRRPARVASNLRTWLFGGALVVALLVGLFAWHMGNGATRAQEDWDRRAKGIFTDEEIERQRGEIERFGGSVEEFKRNSDAARERAKGR